MICFFTHSLLFFFFFFFNDTATTEIYTLSLHDALPIWPTWTPSAAAAAAAVVTASGSIRTRLGRPPPSRASALSSASWTVVTLGCMPPRYGAPVRLTGCSAGDVQHHPRGAGQRADRK